MQTKNYSYSNARIPEKIRNELVSLPVTPAGEPDWQFMEDYIRAIEKVVVKDVVKYKDDVISKTKEVIA